MKNICLYLHVHQPYRIKQYTLFDVGKRSNYFRTKNDDENAQILNKVAFKSYYPFNGLLLKLLNQHPEFKVNFSITGTIVEQMIKYNKGVFDSFKNVIGHKNAEVLGETYYHSLAALYSKEEFRSQVMDHKKLIKKYFNKNIENFRNTELIYSNQIAQYVEDLGFNGIITEGHEKFLFWRSPNYLYKTKTSRGINLLLKNYKLSDDIAWRFSNKQWEEHPLTSEKYLHWLESTDGETVNLFMDYETIGEHQWEETGIFEFLEHFINKAIERGHKFINVKDAANNMEPKDTVDIPYLISWADEARDLSAWMENSMQQDSLNKIYSLEKDILKTKNKKLIKKWRLLQTSDHFYYMCTKWFNDGDAHKYFSPYDSPYEAYNNFNNAYLDLNCKLKEVLKT